MILSEFLKVMDSNTDHLDRLNLITLQTMTDMANTIIALIIMWHIGFKIAYLELI